MIQPHETPNSPARLDVEPLDYANPWVDLDDTDAADRSLRYGIGCWVAFPILAIVNLTFCFFVVIFAVHGFRLGCKSLRNEGCQRRAIVGIILNVLALWPMVGLIILITAGLVGSWEAGLAIAVIVIGCIAM
jgi:hypothetical protein